MHSEQTDRQIYFFIGIDYLIISFKYILSYYQYVVLMCHENEQTRCLLRVIEKKWMHHCYEQNKQRIPYIFVL